jgi:hypothetical protein
VGILIPLPYFAVVGILFFLEDAVVTTHWTLIHHRIGGMLAKTGIVHQLERAVRTAGIFRYKGVLATDIRLECMDRAQVIFKKDAPHLIAR